MSAIERVTLSLGFVEDRLQRPFFVALCYLALAVASTWPLALHLSDQLPLGSEEAATVPLFNLWTLWWNSDRAAVLFADYWQAPIFYPSGDAFTFSEPLLPSVCVVPLVWLWQRPAIAYNCLLLVGLTLNGWTSCMLLRRLRLHPGLALFGGAMVVLLPLVHSWLGVLQLTPLFGIILTLSALDRFFLRPTVRNGLFSGASYALTFLLCSYYGLFLFLPLLGSAPLLFRRQSLQLATIGKLLPGLFLCCLLVAPQVMAQQHALGSSMHHDPRLLAGLSATVADYLVAPKPSLFGIPAFAPPEHHIAFKLGPGFFFAALALLGVVSGLASNARRRWTLFLLFFGGSALVLSLGPLFVVGSIRPYLLLVDYLSGFAQARNVFRFAVFVHLAITFLAAFGLQALYSAGRQASFSRRTVQRFGVLCLTVAALLEDFPARQPLYPLPGDDKPSWVSWLRTNSDKASVLACIPFALKPDVASYQQETLWMYWQTKHHRRMVNGYSGYFPEVFKNLKWPMAEFPASATIDRLQSLGVDYCVVRSNTDQGRYIAAVYHHDKRLIPAFRDDENSVDIYRLRR